MIPLITVFVSGLFGLTVAVVTWILSSKREKTKHEQELFYQDYKRTEDFFIKCLANLNKIIRVTQSPVDYFELDDEIARVKAESMLIADDSINNKLYSISDIMYEWSAAYRKGRPKRIGDTNLAMVSNLDSKHIERANELFIDLSKEINDLAAIMRNQLGELRKKL